LVLLFFFFSLDSQFTHKMVLFKQSLKRIFGFRGNPEKEGKNERGEQSIYNCMDH
jgi:hypothetical protein